MYAVLATVSHGYPPLLGRLPTCYSPVRHSPPFYFHLSFRRKSFPFDLHVLSTPLAFILSQDQTLRFSEESTLRESPLSCYRKVLARTSCHFLLKSRILHLPDPKTSSTSLRLGSLAYLTTLQLLMCPSSLYLTSSLYLCQIGNRSICN